MLARFQVLSKSRPVKKNLLYPGLQKKCEPIDIDLKTTINNEHNSKSKYKNPQYSEIKEVVVENEHFEFLR